MSCYINAQQKSNKLEKVDIILKPIVRYHGTFFPLHMQSKAQWRNGGTRQLLQCYKILLLFLFKDFYNRTCVHITRYFNVPENKYISHTWKSKNTYMYHIYMC